MNQHEQTIPFKYPEQAILVAWDDVEQDNRERQALGDIDDLKESIIRYGLIQPPVVIPHEGGKPWKLTAGGRRMLAMKATGTTHFPVLSREMVKEAERLEMELIENMDRLAMTWQEETLLIARSHQLHKEAATELDSSWGTRETGKIMKCSPTHVSHVLHVAQYLLNNDEEIVAASSVTDAYNILFKRRETECDALRAKQIRKNLGVKNDEQAVVKAQQVKAMSLADMRAIGEGIDSVFDLDKPLGEEERPDFFDDVKEFPLSEWLHKGDSVLEVLPSVKDETFDHIVTDPPYGINIESDYLSTTDKVIATHGKKDNESMFPEMMKQFYRTLRSGGFCIIWYDIEQDALLRRLAKECGFTAQMHPIVWVKTHSCKNQIAAINFTKQHETALVLRKGACALEKPGESNIVIADGSIERKMYSNPFAKPYAVWKHIITAISKPGQVIADPFAGQMSCPRAVLNLGRIPWACEFDEAHFDRGWAVMEDAVKDISGGKGVCK